MFHTERNTPATAIPALPAKLQFHRQKLEPPEITFWRDEALSQNVVAETRVLCESGDHLHEWNGVARNVEETNAVKTALSL